jgi:hypothetical protein
MSTIQIYLDRDGGHLGSSDYCAIIFRAGDVMKCYDSDELSEDWGEEFARHAQDGDIEELAEFITKLVVAGKIDSFDNWGRMELDFNDYWADYQNDVDYNPNRTHQIYFVTEYEE